MGDEVKPELIKKTQDTLSKIIKKPPLTEKLLRKPPFRFLHDITTSIMKETAFFTGVFSPEELVSDNVKDRESKIAFLNKLIAAVNSESPSSVTVKPSKVVAGLEVNKTLELLIAIGHAVESSKRKGQQSVRNEVAKEEKKGEKKGKKSSEEKEKKKSKSKAADGEKPKKSRNREKTEPVVNGTSPSEGTHDKPESKDLNETDLIAKQDKKERKEKKDSHDRPRTRKSRELVDEVEQAPGTSETEADQLVNGEDSIKPEEQPPPVEEKTEPVPIEAKTDPSPPAPPPEKKPEEDPTPTPQRQHSVRPSSAKRRSASRRTAHHDDSSKPKEGPPPKEMSSSTPADHPAIVRPSTAKRPSSARPSSARPGAPRLRDRGEITLPDNNINAGEVGPVTVIEDMAPGVDGGGGGEDDENFVTIEAQPLNADDDVLKPFKDDEVIGQEGELVAQILESKKELEGSVKTSRTSRVVDIDWEGGRKQKRNEWKKEVEELRDGIQKLTRVTNPLGKLFDFLQDDVDSMQREMEYYTVTSKKLLTELEQEQKITENSLEPLRRQLAEVEALIENEQEAVRIVKANIFSNEKKLLNLVRRINA